MCSYCDGKGQATHWPAAVACTHRELFGKWAWVSYHGSIRGAHSLSRSRCASFSSEWSDSEWVASSPTSCLVGSLEAISFPLRREEPWLFVGILVEWLIGVNG